MTVSTSVAAMDRGGPTMPVGTWLLYLHAITAPFFTFSVIVSRDTPSTWVVAGLGLLMLFQVLRSAGRFWVDRTFLYLGALLLCYAAGSVIVYLQDPSATWGGRTPVDRAAAITVRVALAVASYAVFLSFLAEAPDRVVRRLLQLQLAVGAAIAAFGVAQYVLYVVGGSGALTGIEATNEAFRTRTSFVRIAGDRVFRASSVFPEPSYFGFYLVPLLVKAVAIWILRVDVMRRNLLGALIVLLSTAVVMNFSFTAVAGLLVLGLWFLLLTVRRSVVSALGAGAAMVVAVMLVGATPLGEMLMVRMESVLAARDLSSIDRLVRAFAGVRVFLEHPFLGVGPGGFAFLYPAIGFFVERGTMHTPLNLWLTVLTDVGLIGFLPFALFLGSVVRRGAHAASTNALVRVMMWGVGSYLVLLTSVDLWYLDLFWFEVAFLLALAVRARPTVPHPA